MNRLASSVLVLLLASVVSAQSDESIVEDLSNNKSDGMSVILKPKQADNESTDGSEALSTKPRAPVKKVASKKITKKKETKKSTPVKGTSSLERTAEISIRFLINGNSRFAKRNFRADGRSPQDRERGLDGERPHSIVLASSDSRVVPEIIFDQGLGELYTVRVFGENLDSSVIASLEYAVEKLKVPLLVVLGNSDCAAMRLHRENEASEMSPSMKIILDDIDPRLKTLKSADASPSYEVEATLNADAIARELSRRSQIIRTAVENGKLTIKSGLYRINTGRVTFY